MPKSHHFEFVVGVNPGYFHANQCSTPLSAVSLAWDKAAEASIEAGGLYIPVVMHVAKAVYRSEWGCPRGGEDVVIVHGTLNPEFCDVPIRWSACVMLICQAVQKALGQKTATLALYECEFAYLESPDETSK